ncbi:aromatic ring-hydroxylating dioxygenase subunit alpha [Burkholderia sp. BCC1999]|uniref:aromatic ring-hydroxylating dioxygenase subunit alpha n=1 Tax=Burkholderia sp. BCC1999 TaxID=2817448 RepID=UPI002AC31DB3|nr:aromatic ring-hydroxylating dioxygenase subunit alpha [Burkholderia sp. BCC1999]
MKFLRNTWYCAGWGADLGQTDLIDRTILNESVLLYRKEDGSAVAIGNRCPHRFAPLSSGCKKGDNVACPYHGLTFGPSGECVLNPHGDGAIPKAAKVPHYPLVERYEALWIWMGNPDFADEAQIPDFSESSKQQGWGHIRGHLEVPTHYEMLTDNLLDLSHVPYLHPFLSAQGPQPEGFREERELRQDGNTIWSMHRNLNTVTTPLFKLLWEDAPDVIEGYFDMRWSAPSNLLLQAGISAMDGRREDGARIPMAHLLTPASDTHTHYFWCQARNRKGEDPAIDQELKAGIDHVFRNEDEAMLIKCQALMGTTDLMSLKPVLLPGDGPAVRARRILAAQIDAEEKFST